MDAGQSGVPKVEFEGSSLQRARRLREWEEEGKSLALDAPMLLFDLCSGYYVRSLQKHVVPHICKMGFCRSSWQSKCKYDLPYSRIFEVEHHDDAKNRWISQRRNLPDDAFNKTTCLKLLTVTAMNVQINQHSPLAGNSGISYSIKYETKPEPTCTLKGVSSSDDKVVQFLQGQFVSLSAAAACCLGDPITECSLGEMPFVIPAWRITNDDKTQGLWRKYVQRLPCLAMEVCRDGYTGPVQTEEFLMSFLFSPILRVVRYFSKSSDEAVLEDGEAEAEETAVPLKGKVLRVHAGQMNRHVLDDFPDGPENRWYEPVLSQLLPGERLVLDARAQKTDIWQKLKNGSLKFGRFEDIDLSLHERQPGVTNRSCHFEQRVFKTLEWTEIKHAILNVTDICFFLPLDVPISCRPLGSWVKTRPVSELVTANTWLQPAAQKLQAVWLDSAYLCRTSPGFDDVVHKKNSFELFCMYYEKLMQDSAHVCVPAAHAVQCLDVSGVWTQRAGIVAWTICRSLN